MHIFVEIQKMLSLALKFVYAHDLFFGTFLKSRVRGRA
jgi:hypothetical protein